jgi:hypothetical protein
MVSRSLLFGVTLLGVVGLVSIAGCPGGGGGGDGEVTGAEGGGSGEVGTDSQGDGDGDGEETGGGGTQACDDDADCPLPNYGCFDPPDGECACLPGFVLCGEACVDIKTDPLNCGACGNPCGTFCLSGLCGQALPGPGVGPPLLVSGGDPTMECSQANEAKPEHSISGGPGTAGRFVAYQYKPGAAEEAVDPLHNWTEADGQTWTNGLHAIAAPMTLDPRSDPWSATHGGTGLEYVTHIGFDPNGGMFETGCVAVAATDRASIPQGN